MSTNTQRIWSGRKRTRWKNKDDEEEAEHKVVNRRTMMWDPGHTMMSMLQNRLQLMSMSDDIDKIQIACTTKRAAKSDHMCSPPRRVASCLLKRRIGHNLHRKRARGDVAPTRCVVRLAHQRSEMSWITNAAETTMLTTNGSTASI